MTEIARGDRVKVEYPLMPYHGRGGTVVSVRNDKMLGRIVMVQIDRYPFPIGFTASKLWRMRGRVEQRQSQHKRRKNNV